MSMPPASENIAGGVRREVAALLARAIDRYEDTAAAADLRVARARLDEPLRVAIAGKVKAGKSTLLNALVSEELAPTDAGECTKIVTWYTDGLTYRVTLHPREGMPAVVPFSREGGHLDVRLDGHEPAAVSRLIVEWPSPSLRTMTLIDTPGIASLSTDVSERTQAFLAPEDRAGEADAVCYLMRHLHATDVRFLESFHDDEAAGATPMNAVGVLSRADEIGVGRLDALQTAQRIARRYQGASQVRRLCQTVVPVAGLLAQAGVTLRQDEYDALRALTGTDREVADGLLLSTDRFTAADASVPLSAEARSALLERLGLFGVRLGRALLRAGSVGTARELADAFVQHSGVRALRDVLATQFADRADLLKARSALATLEAVLRAHPGPGVADLAGEHERIVASTHAFAEVRVLNALRAGNVALADGALAEAERLLGGHGDAPAARLGLDAAADQAALQAATADAMSRWQRRSEQPLAAREAQEAARTVVRSCEGLLVLLAHPSATGT